LSFAAFLQPKRKISERDFPWDGPLKPTIWDLFDIAHFLQGRGLHFRLFLAGYGPSFDTLLTPSRRGRQWAMNRKVTVEITGDRPDRN
jgi:hypothetical protein